MTKPTREQFLKWAEEAERDCKHPHSYDAYLEALCQRVWDEAINAAEKVPDNVGALLQTEDKCDDYWCGVGAAVEDIEKAIRKLKVKP